MIDDEFVEVVSLMSQYVCEVRTFFSDDQKKQDVFLD